jgi:ATP-dependent 26S proteasome regulatory subunit
MLNTRGLNGHSIRLFQEHTDDAHLERMFRIAASSAPSLVVIEDIDRAFPRTPSPGARCKVSLQQLLNSLDGIDSQDGVIVVATANDPTVLDSAILRRPGRFDRVVALPSPDRQLRLRYFSKFNPHLNDEALFQAAEDSDGLSFAQLKEAYILAGQKAFERNTNVTGNDLLEGIGRARKAPRAFAAHSLASQRRSCSPVLVGRRSLPTCLTGPERNVCYY